MALVLALQQTFGKLFWEIISCPFWWYTVGVWKMLQWFSDQITAEYRNLALGLWLKNLFVPMFGQYDRTGRIVSFFMRLVQIIFRFILLIVWLILLVIIFLFWLISPFLIVYGFWKGNLLFVKNEAIINFFKTLFSFK